MLAFYACVLCLPSLLALPPLLARSPVPHVSPDSIPKATEVINLQNNRAVLNCELRNPSILTGTGTDSLK
jgi:hypothetical protein